MESDRLNDRVAIAGPSDLSTLGPRTAGPLALRARQVQAMPTRAGQTVTLVSSIRRQELWPPVVVMLNQS